MVSPPPSSPAGSTGGRRLLVGIIAGVVAGVLLGGLAPGLARSLGLVGELFLNLLMMLVIPLVMLSMLVGITGLGDLRQLGSMGWRTLVYYMVTTVLAASVGLVAVNWLRPGDGVSPGEAHPQAAYELDPDGHTVRLLDAQWSRAGYDERYVVVLHDQHVRGSIVEVGVDRVTVRLWERHDDAATPLYVTADDGTRLPFRRVEGQLVSSEPALRSTGRGVSISLPPPATDGQDGDGAGAVLREILVGDPSDGSQGLVPRNVFAAMARMEILPLILFSLLLGVAISQLGERAQGVIAALDVLHDAVMAMVHWVMLVTPVGILALVAARIGEAGGFAGFVPELVALGRYALTVTVGLAFHGLVVLPLLLWLMTRRSPLRYARGMAAALLSAVSTSSSSATLPLTIQGVREQGGVSGRSAAFVLPLGATINMDGTALYEAVAAVFVAQVYGVPLSPALQAVVFITATLTAIGAAGIPEAGLVTMIIVLRAVGLPVEGIALLLTIDWLLDRARTLVNVWGDGVGAAIVDRLEQGEAR